EFRRVLFRSGCNQCQATAFSLAHPPTDGLSTGTGLTPTPSGKNQPHTPVAVRKQLVFSGPGAPIVKERFSRFRRQTQNRLPPHRFGLRCDPFGEGVRPLRLHQRAQFERLRSTPKSLDSPTVQGNGETKSLSPPANHGGFGFASGQRRGLRPAPPLR